MDSVGQVYGLSQRVNEHSQRVNEHSQSGNGHSRRVNGRNGAVMNGNVNQEKKKISLGCGQAQRFGEVRPASIGTRFKTREGKRRCVSIV